MKILNRIFRAAGEPPDENIGGDAVTVSDSESVFLTGHKGIREFGKEKITVRMRGYTLVIEGEDMKIACVTEDEAYIVGKIAGVRRE